MGLPPSSSDGEKTTDSEPALTSDAEMVDAAGGWGARAAPVVKLDADTAMGPMPIGATAATATA